jgi:processive 1,2-diacylglycerol beta-glucosyltransferase
MSASDAVITKPGGLTVSESLAKSLPIIIINPIPGQEAKNTHFLLEKKVALRADNEEDLAILIDSLFSTSSKLEAMKKAAASLGKPDAALNIARRLLEL